MTSSILDILHTEFAVCNQHCTVALQVVSDAATRPMLCDALSHVRVTWSTDTNPRNRYRSEQTWCACRTAAGLTTIITVQGNQNAFSGGDESSVRILKLVK